MRSDHTDAIAAALISGDPDEMISVVSAVLEVDVQSQSGVENQLVDAALARETEVRHAAAVGLYAITTAKTSTGYISVRPPTLERMLAALVAEQDPVVKGELLWALGNQDFDGDLLPYASVVIAIIEALAATPAPLSREILSRLNYVHERLRRQDGVEPRVPLPFVERSLIGYAATGLPFILDSASSPKVVLIHNSNLNAWLPPGGHYNPALQEVPTKALEAKVQTETGAACEVLWAAPDFRANESVKVLPKPSFVLLENLKGMKSAWEVHDYHHDENYICRVLPNELENVGHGSRPTIVIDLTGIDKITDPNERRLQLMDRIVEQACRDHPKLDSIVFKDVVERVVLSLAMLREHLPGFATSKERPPVISRLNARRVLSTEFFRSVVSALSEPSAIAEEFIWAVGGQRASPESAEQPADVLWKTLHARKAESVAADTDAVDA